MNGPGPRSGAAGFWKPRISPCRCSPCRGYGCAVALVDTNLKMYTFHSNRVLKITFFVPKYTQRPPPPGPCWFGVLRGVISAHVGPGGTRIRPRGGPSGQKLEKHTFHTNRAPKISLFVKKHAPAAPQPGPRCPRALMDANQAHMRPAGPRIRPEGNSEKLTRKR